MENYPKAKPRKTSTSTQEPLKRSTTLSTKESQQNRPLRKSVSVGHKLCVSPLRNSGSSIHLSEQECETLQTTLNLYKKETETQKRARVFEESVKVYEAYKQASEGACMVNFLFCTEDETLAFCYNYDCDEEDPNLSYLRCLVLTQHISNYAGFESCAIFRIIKFCPSCYQEYTDRNKARLTVINSKAHKLFTPLLIQ